MVHKNFPPSERKLLLHLGGHISKWGPEESKRQFGEHTLCEVEYIWHTSSYFIWPAAARELMASLPVDCPTDNYLSKHIYAGKLRAFVVQPHFHTNPIGAIPTL